MRVKLGNSSPQEAWGEMINLKMNNNEMVDLIVGDKSSGEITEVEIGTILGTQMTGQFKFSCGKDHLVELSNLFKAIFQALGILYSNDVCYESGEFYLKFIL